MCGFEIMSKCRIRRVFFFFFQAEDGIRDLVRSRGLGDVYKRQLVSLSPRYYLVNKDRFALYFNADLGLSYLRIGDVVNGTNRYNDRYGGEHLRIGATSQFFFGSVFGMNVGLKYAANNLRWRDRDPQDPILGLVDYSAKLKTSGVQLQLGLQVKLSLIHISEPTRPY